MKTLTVVIPAYNEEEALADFLPEVVAFCEDHGHRLIVTNDGSCDGTGTLLDTVAASDLVTSIHHKVNRGYGGAIKSAVRAASTDFVVTIDADGQHDLSDVTRLLDEIVSQDADMVVGNRDGNKQAIYRRVGKFIIRRFASLTMSVGITDLNSGIKLFDTALARRYLTLCPDSMAFSDVIALVFIANKHRVVELPVTVRARTGGKSTITTRVAFVTLLEILHTLLLFNPMRVFLPLAITFFLFGVAWNVPIFLRGEGVSVGSMLLIVSGLLFFLLGLITAMLANMRKDRIER